MEIIRDLLIFIGAMFAMCIVLIIVVSRLPEGNPLKRMLDALTYRVGATLLAGVVAVPVEPVERRARRGDEQARVGAARERGISRRRDPWGSCSSIRTGRRFKGYPWVCSDRRRCKNHPPSGAVTPRDSCFPCSENGQHH